MYFMSRQHEVIAIDRHTGAMRWKRATGEPGDTPSGSVVAIADALVLAGDYHVVAFDRGTGSVRWRFTPRAGHGPGLYLGAVIGGTAYAGSPAGYLYAVDVTDGSLRWSASLERDRAATIYPPVVSGDLVVAGFTLFDSPASGGVLAVDAATGAERWRASFPARAWAGGPVAWDEVLVAADSTGAIYGLSRSSGAVEFRIPPDESALPAPQDFRALAVADGILVAGSLSGDVSAFDRETLRRRWRYTAREFGSVAYAMTADDRLVYVPYVGGRLVALDVSTGREHWRTDRSQGLFPWPPAVQHRHVYAAGGNVLAAFAP